MALRCTRRAKVLHADELRQRACTELLRQAAQPAGLLDAGDTCLADGVISEAATVAIEALLEQRSRCPNPRTKHAAAITLAHAEALSQPASALRVRHILFAVTPGVDVVALRKQAETALLDVRCHDGKRVDRFADAARQDVQLSERRHRR